ncbi:MAG: GNAT family N-acetyltransferase [bacterium]|nr:GNAT family N-acetyltransferase [bacterium]
MNIIIEKAKPEDSKEITKVIIASKKYWGYPEEWFKQWNDLVITPQTIETRDFYVGRIKNEIIFVYSIKYLTVSKYELEDCWILPDYIGKGYGKLLFKDLDKKLDVLKCTSLRICSDPNAEGFYIKMGAVKIAEEPSKIKGRIFPIFEYKAKKLT